MFWLYNWLITEVIKHFNREFHLSTHSNLVELTGYYLRRGDYAFVDVRLSVWLLAE